MSALGKIAAILGVKPKKDYDTKQYDTSGLKPVGVPEDNIGAPPPMAVKPQVQTIGGLQIDGKPEIDTPQYDASRYDMSGMQPVGVPPVSQEGPQQLQGRNPMAVRPLDEQISTITNKDYSIQKDPQTGEITHYGKDRDRKWSLGEKVGSFLMGMFNGDGAIPAAMDRNYMEKLRDKQDLRRLAPMQKLEQQNQEFNTQQKTRELNNEILAVKPDIMQQNADTATLKAQVDAEYKNNVITLGKQKADDIKTYREQILDLKARGLDQNDTRIQQLQQRIDETIRHNKAGEDDRDADRASKEKIATQKNQTEIQKETIKGDVKTRLQSEKQKLGDAPAKKRATASFVNAYFRKNGSQPTSEEINQYLTSIGY